MCTSAGNFSSQFAVQSGESKAGYWKCALNTNYTFVEVLMRFGEVYWQAFSDTLRIMYRHCISTLKGSVEL